MEMGTKSVPLLQTIATIVFLGCYMISNLPKESKFDPTSHTLSVQAVKRVLNKADIHKLYEMHDTGIKRQCILERTWQRRRHPTHK